MYDSIYIAFKNGQNECMVGDINLLSRIYDLKIFSLIL